jgi:hypothetical protein
MDNYLRSEGKLGFLITQTVFKAKGQAEGFRRFKLGSKGEPFCVNRVDDFSKINPFEGASNLTVSFVAIKGREQTYPVPYIVWIPRTGKAVVPLDWQIDQARDFLTPAVEEAHPVDSNRSNSHWQTSSHETVTSLRNLTGQAAYQAKIGARTDPYGVFQLRILKKISEDRVLVENCFDSGKRKIERLQAPLESARLHPLIRGRDVDRWIIKPENYVLMVQDPEKRSPIPERTLKKDLPKTYSYLLHFKKELLQRGSRAVKSLMASSEFYAMFAIGVETYSPYKVVWRRMGSDFRAAFCSSIEDEFLGNKLVIPSDTVSFVPFDDDREAYFFLGLINSTPARAAIYSFSPPGRGLGAPSMLHNLRIGAFDDADRGLRKTISDLARKISKSVAKTTPDFASLQTWTSELDSLVAEYWKIPAKELVLLEGLVSKRERSRTKKQLGSKSDSELLEEFSELFDA